MRPPAPADRRPAPRPAPSAAVVALATAMLIAGALASVPAAAQDGATPTGRIAWIEGGVAIHASAADGSGDATIHAIDPASPGGIGSVAWRPDGAAIAWASAEEALCSIWQSDLYVAAADGSAARRLTNGPSCSTLAGLPAGTIRVTVENRLTADVVLLVHAHGLETAQALDLAASTATTVELTGVRDLGPETPQFVVVEDGMTTWFDASVYADVAEGTTVDAGTLVIDDAHGIDGWGALALSWAPDGDRLAYQQGVDALWQIAADAADLEIGTPLFAAPLPDGFRATSPVWAPTGDRVLYHRYDADPSTIGIGTVDAVGAGGDVLPVSIGWGADWLPDGSGFIAADVEPRAAGAALLRVDLVTGALERIEPPSGGYAVWPTVSPDGAFVAYEWSAASPQSGGPSEIRILELATGAERTLVADGSRPEWGP